MATNVEDAKILYHYTSSKGLVGILTGREILMSDIRFLNDSQEWRHAGKIVAKTISDMSEDLWPAYRDLQCGRDAYNGFVGRLVKHFNTMQFGNPLTNSNNFRSFVFCLSRKCDALSQWRAYGGGEYCIAFDREKLAATARTKLVPVRYHDEVPDPLVRNLLLRHLSPNQGQIVQGRLHPEVLSDTALGLQEVLLRAHYLNATKSDGFKEEDEVRLLAEIPIVGNNDIFFDVTGRYPKPRIKIPLVKEIRDEDPVARRSRVAKEFRALIKGVFCGPGTDEEMAENVFEMLNRSSGLSVSPQYSKIPFRQY